MKTPVHLSIGAETIASSIINIFGSDQLYFGTYRSHALYLSLTKDVLGFLGELYGKEIGICAGRAGSMHLINKNKNLLATSAIVGSSIPLAVGAALADKLNGSNKRSIVFFGDGALEEGVSHESFNFAALKKLNTVFVCEDNKLAIHAHQNDRQSFIDYKKLMEAYSIPYFSCHATEIEELIATITEAKRITGPVFIHCHYHRFLEHVGISEDYKFNYREEPTDKVKLDPLHSFKKLVTNDKYQEFEQRITTLIKDVYTEVQSSYFISKDSVSRFVL